MSKCPRMPEEEFAEKKMYVSLWRPSMLLPSPLIHSCIKYESKLLAVGLERDVNKYVKVPNIKNDFGGLDQRPHFIDIERSETYFIATLFVGPPL